jgi:purine-binding chemotaxis protein CheW
VAQYILNQDFGDYFCFRIDDVQLGIPLHNIDRVIRSVAVNQLPNSPRIVHGLIDYYGEIVPVINLRRRLALNEKSLSPDQFFVMVDTSARKLALVADSADEVISFTADRLIFRAGWIQVWKHRVFSKRKMGFY